LEKVAYALVMASRKLRHYFTSHKITVPTSLPLRDMFENKEAIGRIAKWATEIAPFMIVFVARTSLKSQALADFVAEWTPLTEASDDEPPEPICIAYCGGAWGATGAGVSAIMLSPSGTKLRYAARLEFHSTNNTAEYETVLLVLRKAKALGAWRLLVKTNSKVVASQIGKTFQAKEPELIKYRAAVRRMEKYFLGLTVKSISRNANTEADELAKATSQNLPMSSDVFYQKLTEPALEDTLNQTRLVATIESEDWLSPILAYLHGQRDIED
jgi:ribonuclease HI